MWLEGAIRFSLIWIILSDIIFERKKVYNIKFNIFLVFLRFLKVDFYIGTFSKPKLIGLLHLNNKITFNNVGNFFF